MAKPRKSKNEEQKPESSVVLHQKLCLSIEMDKRKIYGYTELKISVPDGGHVAMHADNILISNITVDGEPAEFEHFSHYQPVEDETKWSSVSCVKTAADAASSTYHLSLNKEVDPNLLISCHNLKKPLNDQNQEDTRIVEQNSSVDQVVNGYSHPEDKTQTVKLVRINYLVDKAETGVHFGGNVLHTNNQIRRARCWFPCVDNISERCPFDMEFTVNSNYVAVSNGNLLYQVLSKDDPPRRTYVYNVSVPVSAGWISLAVAPFEILPDSHTSIVSHMCLTPYNSKLQNTVGFFHSAFSHYEDYLSAAFPFGSYKQIFIPPELAISSVSLGASMCIFSSQLLYDEKIIDQTIETRIKLAYALARQWFGIYITAEEPVDEWLVDGMAGFLADSFIKRFLGNNEARYRLYKANCAVCKVDISGATALSSVAASTDLYGTQSIGLYGKIRSWKAVAVLQMLEKQMGPDSFRKILQNIVNKAADTTRSRTLSTKEFNNLAYKVGNLERPFLKEFFPSWVESCGCPVLRMGLSYNKRKNMIELAVMRGCTAKTSCISSSNPESGTREGDAGWPGMMSIRVHELDGMYDHPSLPMAGDTWQLLEIQCHSKLAAKRIQKSKKGSKPDGSDDNAEITPTLDMRTSMDTPLLWIRADPEMEYLAEIHFHQPVQMWINQLEKDKDVVAQAQAIATLEKLPQLSFSVVNALNNFLTDSKAFWRVRIEAAYALAHTASEDTDWAGLLHLIKFYKSRRFDPDIGLPRPNDFHDVSEYFVLEAIPHAVSLIRAADQKSPREAVEFVLQLLKYNDNNGNPYSDVFWLSALVQSIGELEFNQQTVSFLSSLLKRIDRLLQFDSLMPSYNGMLTISCIRTLAQIALKISSSLPLEHVSNLIKPFQNSEKVSWAVRIEASKVLLDLEFYCKSLDAALVLFLRFLEEETSLRGETKLAAHMMHLCQENVEDSEHVNFVSCPTLIALLKMLASRNAFNNVCLRHCLYCILQIVAERPPTLYGVPKVQLQPVATVEPFSEQQAKPASSLKLRIPRPQEPPPADTPNISLEISALPVAELAREADTISNCSERRKNILKIKVKQPGSSSKVDDADHLMENSRCSQNEAPEIGPASSVSVDAPSQRYAYEAPFASNQNIEEVNSCHNQESHMSASIGSSAKLNREDGAKDLQCTADSVKIIHGDHPSPPIRRNNDEMVIHLQDRSLGRYDGDPGAPVPMVSDEEAREKRKKNKKDKEKKRKREEKSGEKDRSNDPDYLERKRQKKEKKRMEKELAKMKQQGDGKASGNSALAVVEGSKGISSLGESKKSEGSMEQRSVSVVGETNSAPKLKIKIKGLGRGIR